MKNNKVYKTSIIVALIVPLIIGFIYYKDVSSRVLQNNLDISSQESPEIVYETSDKIEGIDGVAIPDSNYANASYYDFNVTYMDQNYGNNEFNLYLNNVSFSDSINPSNLKWRLAEYNYETNDYDVIFFGDFAKLENGKINIGKNIPIGKDNFQKYRLYYYIAFNNLDRKDYSNSKFYAEIGIE